MTPAAPSAFNPLVAQILASTNQPSWFQFVRTLRRQFRRHRRADLDDHDALFRRDVPDAADQRARHRIPRRQGRAVGYAGTARRTRGDSGCGGSRRSRGRT
jgi:hypothetical protein